MGWGIAENGLILYSLYFGWAFIALVFMLINTIEDKLKTKWIVPTVSIAATTCLACINIPAILEMVKYLAEICPT